MFPTVRHKAEEMSFKEVPSLKDHQEVGNALL